MIKFRTTLLIAFLLANYASLLCQTNKFEINRFKKDDPFALKWDCQIVEKYIEQKKIISRFSFGTVVATHEVDSLLKKSNYSFYAETIINPQITSLLFLEKVTPDTIECLEDIEYKLILFNFNKRCELISSACIAKYERINSGLSFSGLDAELIFKRNSILIKEVEDSHPVDMMVRFKITDNTFKTRKEFIINLDDNGSLAQKK
jgi:hypothetical protein